MRILLYTRHNMTHWVRHVASRLTCASHVVIMSELRSEGDISIADRFYNYLRAPDVGEKAVLRFGDEGCSDIIARCRVLRSLGREQAIRMIGAVWQASVDVFNEVDPDLFLGLRVDSYVLDIIERITRERGVTFVGLWRAAIVPNMIFFTARGEFRPVREPPEEAVSDAVAAIMDSDFKATSLDSTAKYTFKTFTKKRLYYFARDSFLNLQRWVVRDPLGYRYLASGRHVKEYRVGLRDTTFLTYVNHSWEQILDATPPNRRLFIGLQVNPEATIDYYVKNVELIDCQRVLLRVVKVFEEAGFSIFVKDHPNMFGMRGVTFFKALAQMRAVAFVPYEVPSNPLVLNCTATFTWSGTVGLQAAMAGRCSIVAQPTYYVPGPFIQFKTLSDIDDLPRRVAMFRPQDDLGETRRTLVRHILRSFVPGSLDWAGFNRRDPKALQGVATLVASLNSYLPRLAGA